MKNIILSARDVSKSFAHDGGQIHVISHLDLDIYESDFTVIMGASGSGKSTLLYALSGMDKATGGSVIYNNIDLTKASENELAKLRHTEFGFIFQQMHLVNNLSLFENIVVPGYLNKEKTKEEINSKALELMELMSISHVKKHLPSQVSGGEQQRCAIARAVINDAKLLFADEPTGALNKTNTIEVLNLLTNLNNNGQSILMVTHDVRSALRASRVIYLEDGKVKGEITLPPYKLEDEKSREAQLNSWLSSMKW
ncbi:MAG: ABC transporter ATP-binding protein [Erysipelotrichaceae bacterium]|nr:ABC transporter ATP-binding protein [Erysipelotrichaceae bacterium]